MKESATDKFLAVRFPHVPRSWLRRLNERLGLLKALNGGNVEMRVRWHAGQVQWTDWTDREVTPRQGD